MAAICEQLKDPEKRVDNIRLDLMQPYKPMLAQRGDAGIDKVCGDSQDFLVVRC